MAVQNTMSRYFGASHKIVISRRCLTEMAVISEKMEVATHGRSAADTASKAIALHDEPALHQRINAPFH
jgi:hypothetical protein